MGGKNKIGILYIIVGLIVVVLSLIFDLLGGSPGFGTFQIIGLIVGLIVTGIGFWLKSKK
ncbi:hypothetical protein JXQ31_15300 [candidate division KSB1 bacterium]|nr:hypothetical protein [candidate division KSB1 bacterium]